MGESDLLRTIEQALDLPENERANFLAQRLEDPKEVERALRSLELGKIEDSFLERPVRVNVVPPGRPPLQKSRLAEGDRVASYEIERFLAAGGMGAVYVARQANPSRRIALKLMASGTLDVPSRERFQREAEVLARLQHPAIAAVYSSGVDEVAGESLPYLAMEYVEDASSLIEYAERCRQDIDDRVRVFLQVCDGVSHGHQRGVIHRDLKPTNLLVDGQGRVKVIDYGIALEEARTTSDLRLTQGAQFMGTLGFMSPEQIDAPRDVDTRTDVYSLGAVLYELLAGSPPFDLEDTSFSDAVRTVTTADPPPLTSRRAGIPCELGWVVARCLRKDREERYGSVDDLARDLRHYLAHEPVTATPLGWAYRARKFVRRNRVACALGGSAFVGGLIGLVAILTLNFRLAVASTVAEARADDILSLATSRDLESLIAQADQLWPIHPKDTPRYERWLAEARSLVSGREADPGSEIVARPSLDDHRRKLSELQRTARDETDPVKLAAAAVHPRAEELRAARARRTWMRRMLGHAPWPDRAEARRRAARQPLPNAYFNWFKAWQRVGPEADLLDEASLGWAHALAGTATPFSEMTPQLWMSLAWAEARHGELDRALETANVAMCYDGIALMDREHDKLRQLVQRWRDEELSGRQAELELLGERIQRLEIEVGERVIEDDRSAWWQAQLAALVTGIEDLHDPRSGLAGESIAAPFGWGISRRLEFARELAPDSDSARARRTAWDRASEAIEAHPEYSGLRVTPQLGLLPLGPDPNSGLWEFAHLQSGVPPRRQPDGTLELGEGTGIVLVLLPAGSFWMGAQRRDRDGRNYESCAYRAEGPVHRVEVPAFFLSKYEMTQGQWVRAHGRNPSQYAPNRSSPNQNRVRKKVTWCHPVEQVTWLDCVEAMRRLDLELPSESQWEYACRAGSDRPFWCGEEPASLADVGNVADQFAAIEGGGWGKFEAHDDGYRVHAPVGTFRANDFGLHDVHGNVAEWCFDELADRYWEPEGFDPSMAGDGTSGYKVFRGGSFRSDASVARCAFRDGRAPHDRAMSVGLRPSRELRP